LKALSIGLTQFICSAGFAIWALACCQLNARAETVHIRQPASELLRTAATEIRQYAPALPALRNATIYLGTVPERDTRFSLPTTPLNGDSYYLRAEDNVIAILGGTDRGVLFGTYDLIERLGVTWYAPGKTHVTPVFETIARLDVLSKPAFNHRGLIADWSSWAERDLVQWAARNRLNTIALPRPGLIETLRDTYNQVADRGIMLEIEFHALSFLVPRSLFADHPDYFRKDRRAVPHQNGNLCCSNHDALRVLAENARRYATRFPPQTERFFLWQDDGAPWCRCQACRKLSPSDQSLRAANTIVNAIRQDRPGAKLAYLAYHDTLQPAENVAAADGLFLEFAPIMRCYAHALDDPMCERNRWHYKRLQLLLEKYGRADSQALEYWLDVSRWSRWQRPFVRAPEVSHVLPQDLNAYRRAGIEHVATFCLGYDPEYFDEYTSFAPYLYAKLLWNPDEDVATLRNRYCEAAGIPLSLQNQLETCSSDILRIEVHNMSGAITAPSGRDGVGLQQLYSRRCNR